jgi:hypothetical protein
MAEIYRQFNPAEDIITGDIQVVSTPLWSENINPLSRSYGGDTALGFFTSSTQFAASGYYYTDVYQRNPQTDNGAEIQFAIAYGHRLGSGSAGDPNTTGQNVNDTPTRAIYGQYRNLLLPPNDTVFTFGGSGDSDAIIVLNISRARYRQKIDPGNWELRIARGATGTNPTTDYISLIDGSGAGEDPGVNASGRVFYVYSGSGGEISTANNADGNDWRTRPLGLFYPDAGIIVLNADSGSNGLLSLTGGTTYASNATWGWNTGSNSNNGQNAAMMYRRISGSSYFAARSEEKINSTHYFVRATNKQFNFSNNPTFVTGSNGAFLYPQMYTNPSVYITTIGMYDDINRLLAVAKLSQPVLKSFNREVLIKVKLDY